MPPAVARTVSGTVADIDERKRAEAALAEREQRLRDVVEASGEYVWETDAQWRYTYLSERVEAVLGYARRGSREEARRLHAARRAEGGRRVVRRSAAEGRPFRDLLHRMITKSGGVIWLSVSGVPVRDAEGRCSAGAAPAPTSPRASMPRRASSSSPRATRSPACRTPLLADRASQAILTAARSRSQFALLCIDLDRFTLVNDSLGHRAGDALLRSVAERLANLVHGEDTLARLGGDDFVLVQAIRSKGDPAEAAARRSAILGVLARPLPCRARRSTSPRRSASASTRTTGATSSSC